MNKMYKHSESLGEQIAKRMINFSEPTKYSREWFEKNNIDPWTSVPSSYANKAVKAENEAWKRYNRDVDTDSLYQSYYGEIPFDLKKAEDNAPKRLKSGDLYWTGRTDFRKEFEAELKSLKDKDKFIREELSNPYYDSLDKDEAIKIASEIYNSNKEQAKQDLKNWKISNKPYWRKQKRLYEAWEEKYHSPDFEDILQKANALHPDRVGDKAIAEQYKIAESKGLVRPDQTYWTGKAYRKVPNGYEVEEQVHDYAKLKKV